MKRRAAAIIAAGIFAVLLAFCVGWSLSQRSGATTVRLSELQARSHAAPQTTQSQIDLSEKINLNTASAAQLQVLPGIGATYAERIIAYREANGGFSSIEELMEVKGIGEKRFAALKDYVTVEEANENSGSR